MVAGVVRERGLRSTDVHAWEWHHLQRVYALIQREIDERDRADIYKHQLGVLRGVAQALGSDVPPLPEPDTPSAASHRGADADPDAMGLVEQVFANNPDLR